MYARVITKQFSPDKVDEALRLWRDTALPVAKEQRGFKSGRLLVDRKAGKAISIFLWETEADAKASGEGSAYLQGVLAKFASLLTAPPVIEHYEVVGEE